METRSFHTLSGTALDLAQFSYLAGSNLRKFGFLFRILEMLLDLVSDLLRGNKLNGWALISSLAAVVLESSTTSQTTTHLVMRCPICPN